MVKRQRPKFTGGNLIKIPIVSKMNTHAIKKKLENQMMEAEEE